MNKVFYLSGILTTIVNLLLHTLAYIFILKDCYLFYPAISEECREQLFKPANKLIIWAMFVRSLTMGFSHYYNIPLGWCKKIYIRFKGYKN